MGFDEVNVLRESISLYQNLYEDCKKEWRLLYRDRYEEVSTWLIGKKPDEDELDELVELELSRLLYTSNPVTKYIFDAEVLRKRDRMFENLLAAPTKAQKQLAMDKALRFLVQMIGWYTDFASQDAEIAAFENAGITKVKRREMSDERVCQICRELDGKIYSVKKIPVLEHLRCRRWFIPVRQIPS